MSEVGDRRPRYLRLRDQIALEITQHIWRPGEPIPTEHVLAAQYGTSLGPVIKALNLLVADRLIERIQGKGSFVRRPDWGTAHVRCIRYHGSAADQRTLQSKIIERKAVVGPRRVTSALQLKQNARVIRLKRLRFFKRRLVLYEDVWLEERQFKQVLELPEDELRLLYPIYERLCGVVVACAEETITIGTATRLDIEKLLILEGGPVVLMDRVAYGFDKRPIEFCQSRGPASDFCYKIEIR